jgi:hypothetical protein
VIGHALPSLEELYSPRAVEMEQVNVSANVIVNYIIKYTYSLKCSAPNATSVLGRQAGKSIAALVHHVTQAQASAEGADKCPKV